MESNKRAHNFTDMIGQKFGRLKVISFDCIKKRESYWKCICECGKECIKRGQNLKRGGTTSCGCYRLERTRLEKGMSGFNRIYSSYLTGAIERKLSFHLTINKFKQLTKQNCHYCNVEPRQTGMAVNKGLTTQEGRDYSTYVYNGIDRKDNKVGYTLKNSVTCCKICNRAKSSLSYDDFMEYINRIKDQ